ncbi:MAG TPA: sugar phosphate isomerase/epimerase [Candidatus Pullichristensenella excrementigallinarum]|uniref:Sugar phosphate isomerase/epimerase n=1 Tax=Candidatus Pullichristensenella excrementigallinarum TaxID=2840907 RepID=A0A9D1LD02_9FIRM|nr:sugar phosphate isomerase/epimerase [Candidatus Pullichristensenella excrementigallinarum]
MAFKHLTQAQIATSTFPYCKCGLDWTLDSLQRVGVRAFELQAVDPILSLEDVRPADIRALAKKIRKRGLQTICVTPDVMNYPINLASPDPSCRRRSLDCIRKAVDCAEGLESPCVQMHVGYATVDGNWEEAWKRSADAMRILGQYAVEHGVIITSEYSKLSWKSVLNSSQALRKMIDEVDSPGYQAMSDTVVMVKIPETIDDVARNVGHCLKHFHFTDGLGNATSSLHMIPGTGKLDLEHVLEVLDEIGYTGYLSLELQDCNTAPEEGMRRAVQWMREHLPE